MKNFLINKVLGFFLGDKNKIELKHIEKIVEKIKSFEKPYADLSDDALHLKTADFKRQIASFTHDLSQELEVLTTKAKLVQDLREKENLYDDIDKLKNKIYLLEEQSLSNLLPEAFALMKETARRFKEKDQIIIKSTDFDKKLSLTKDYVVLEGENAVWKTKWDAAGKPIIWDLLYYDVQLMGGVVLHDGKIAEMATGEGKTLVATLSIYLNALLERGVHVVTVNDYLAKRDASWMAPLMEFHGLVVDCIDLYPPNTPLRRKAYEADITYGTNNEFGFDYLRDNMAHRPQELVQRELNYAIIDEVDSVLIDDARTPLIISGPVGDDAHAHEFNFLKPKVEFIINEQKKHLNKALNDSRLLFKEGNNKEASNKLFQVYRGFPKYKPLIKFLSQDNIRVSLQKSESFYMQDNNKEMPKIDAHLYFVIDEKNNSVELTDKGIEALSKQVEDPNFFILPDISVKIIEIEQKNLPKKEEMSLKSKLLKDFSIKSERLHSINQLLKAYTLFEKDIEYVVIDEQVKIVDEQTGRIMEGRRYSDGLHQALEAKENVRIEKSSQTFATITLQNYFRMYRKLAGMTGTAETEAEEFWKIYKLEIIVVPTNKPTKRKDLDDFVYKTQREKYNAILDQIIDISQNQKRPVLVGTTSVEVSELLSRSLRIRKIDHNVLNAKLHKKEADIIAQAGLSSIVTIATNMAGRGTDIKLNDKVVEAGGLAILGVERHDSRRVDRQLRGRSGRQGDPGTSQFYVSLEDNLMRLFAGSERLARLMDRFGHKTGDVIQHPLVTRSLQRAQKKVEENNFGIRKRLLEYDDVMNKQREIIYKRRKNALLGERISIEIASMIYTIASSLFIRYKENKLEFKDFEYEYFNVFFSQVPLKKEELDGLNDIGFHQRVSNVLFDSYLKRQDELALKIFTIVGEIYAKNPIREDIQLPFVDIEGEQSIFVLCDVKKMNQSRGKSVLYDLERNLILSIIDERWKEHLREMDHLRQSVQTAVYEQKDPLLTYKKEAFSLFKDMIHRIDREIISFLFKADLPSVEHYSAMKENYLSAKKNAPKLTLEKAQESNSSNASTFLGKEISFNPNKVLEKKIGRNEKVKIRHLQTGEEKDMKFKQALELIEKGEWELDEDK